MWLMNDDEWEFLKTLPIRHKVPSLLLYIILCILARLGDLVDTIEADWRRMQPLERGFCGVLIAGIAIAWLATFIMVGCGIWRGV